MGLIPLSQDDVRESLDVIVRQKCADGVADTLRGRGFLAGRKYLSYFALSSLEDDEPTLRIAFVTSNDTVRKKTLVLRRRASDRMLRDPSELDGIVKDSKAKRIVACYSVPDGCDDIRYTIEKLQGVFYAVTSAEFYDFVLIDGGELYSLIRIYKDGRKNI